jgi:putative PIN family toxin of toxin-antitoxin system
MTTLRIVLDSNVLISAIHFGSLPREVFRRAVEGRVEVFVSPAILEELRGVLRRPKFGMPASQVEKIVEEFCAVAELVEPTVRIKAVPADPPDDRVLECAVASRADFIVTGDGHLLHLGMFRGIRILSPRQFLEGIT